MLIRYLWLKMRAFISYQKIDYNLWRDAEIAREKMGSPNY